MANWMGYRPASSTVYIALTTHYGYGSPVAPLSAFEVGDFVIYKNGSATQRSSTSGWSIASPFDSVVGLHYLTIDLSDNTDAGFYAAGSFYEVFVNPDTETVDGNIILRSIASFDIGPVAANVTQLLGTAWLTPGVAGTPDVNLITGAVTSIWAKAMADMTAVPAATGTVLDAINWLFMLGRNLLTQTATTATLKKDNSSTTVATSAVADDGTTFSRAKWT